MAPGSYSITWNAAHHASGVYFAKLDMMGGRKTLVNKLMLVK
jgi:hypothetical protein